MNFKPNIQLFEINERYLHYRYLLITSTETFLVWEEADRIIIDQLKKIPKEEDYLKFYQLKEEELKANERHQFDYVKKINQIGEEIDFLIGQYNDGKDDFDSLAFRQTLEVFQLYQKNLLKQISPTQLLTHPSQKIRDLIKKIFNQTN